MWTTLTSADLDDYMVAEKADAARAEALRTSPAAQSDTFDIVMQDVARIVRMEVATCLRNRLSAQPFAIPQELRRDALAMIVEGISLRLGMRLNEDEIRAAKTAREQLHRAAKGELILEQPLDPLNPAPDHSTTGQWGSDARRTA